MLRRAFPGTVGSLLACALVVGACATSTTGCGGGGGSTGDLPVDDTGLGDEAGDETGGDGTSTESSPGDSAATDSSTTEGGDDSGSLDSSTTEGGDDSASTTDSITEGGDGSSGDTVLDDADAAGDSAIGSDSGAGTDSGTVVDSAPADTAPLDTGTIVDTSPLDSGVDTAPVDSGTLVDSAPLDTGVDTAPIDTGIDTGPPACGSGSCTVDTDRDGIPDSVEGSCLTPAVDTDGDGTADYLDLDSDNDTIPDKVEWAGGGCDPSVLLNDVNGDGVPNFRDLDSDGNGLPDKFEACPPVTIAPGCTPATPADLDGDGVQDWLDSENDHDSPSPDPTIGLEDRFELVNNAGVYVGPKVLVPYKTYDTTQALIDTDSDGVPDVWDRDADNDNIFDLQDGLGDPNGNGVANFRDRDSDGDGVPDVCEARANPVFTPSYVEAGKPLLDTNADGKLDYLQRDTDGDYLLDGVGPLGAATGEDKNGDCIVQATETDRLKPDTDGDGVSDFIEVTLVDVACAKDPACTPAKRGKFYFVETYTPDGSVAPSPTSSPLALSTTLNNGDVGFVVDTTYSMSGEINNLKTSLKSIITSLAAKIPNLGVGVAGHEDVPDGTNSSCTPYAFPPPFLPADRLWYQPAGFIVDVSAAGTPIAGGITTAQNQVNGLTLGDGYDLPEGQTLVLIHGINGDLISWPNIGSGCPAGSVPADNGDGGVTTFGAMHFRTKALPMIVEITDAPWHNGITVGSATTHDNYPFATFNSANLVSKMNALGAKFIGVAADNGGRAGGGPGGNPYLDEAYVTDNTNSDVPTTAFGATGKCATGVGGALIAADGPGGTCRSVYSINTDGTGLSTSIVNGVYAILASIKFDVYVQAYNDPAATIDVIGDFMQKVEPTPAGGTDPVTGGVCVSFPAAQLADRWVGPKALAAGTDGVWDTIKAVNPGSLYCFNVVPKANTIVTPTSSAQIFTGWLKVLAQKPAPATGTFALGTDRQVLFIVPPIVN